MPGATLAPLRMFRHLGKWRFFAKCTLVYCLYLPNHSPYVENVNSINVQNNIVYKDDKNAFCRRSIYLGVTTGCMLRLFTSITLILSIINKTVKMRDKKLRIGGFINFSILNMNPSGATESHFIKSRHL